MLYLNDGGAHVGGGASHGAVRRQKLPRDRRGGSLARGKHKDKRQRRSCSWEKPLQKPRLLSSLLSGPGIERVQLGREAGCLTGSQGQLWGLKEGVVA